MRTMMWMGTWGMVCALLLAGCSVTPRSTEHQAQLTARSENAIATAKKADPGLQKFFDTAAGYAVFPSVGKGAAGLGVAYGRGTVFEGDKLIGYTTLTQGTIGLAAGGQKYTELIFFEDKAALDRFVGGRLDFAAQASAVALKSGVSANAKYSGGVAVFTLAEAGLMFEASIGGQQFAFAPVRTQ